jgi:hypothetical protein
MESEMNVIAEVDLKKNEIKLCSLPGNEVLITRTQKDLDKLWYTDIREKCKRLAESINCFFAGFKIVNEEVSK